MAAHFEIYVNDMARAKAFYSGLFGWTFTAVPELEAVDYQMISGTHFNDHLTGGMLRRPDQSHAPGTAVRGGTMRFEVEDADERYAWALANGGAEALPPMDFPGVGRLAFVEDGEGNIVAMLTAPAGEA